MIELLKEALKTIKFLKDYCESDDPGLEIGAPVIKKLEEAITNGTWRGLTDEERNQFRQWAHPEIIDAIELKLQERNP